jgi:hypothetical protein
VSRYFQSDVERDAYACGAVAPAPPYGDKASPTSYGAPDGCGAAGGYGGQYAHPPQFGPPAQAHQPQHVQPYGYPCQWSSAAQPPQYGCKGQDYPDHQQARGGPPAAPEHGAPMYERASHYNN